MDFFLYNKDRLYSTHQGIFPPRSTLNPVLASIEIAAVVAASVALGIFGCFERGDLASTGLVIGKFLLVGLLVC